MAWRPPASLLWEAVKNADSGAPPQTWQIRILVGGSQESAFLQTPHVILQYAGIWASPCWKQGGWNGYLLFWLPRSTPVSSPSCGSDGFCYMFLVIPLCWPQPAELGKGTCPHLDNQTFPGIFKLGILALVPLWK